MAQTNEAVKQLLGRLNTSLYFCRALMTAEVIGGIALLFWFRDASWACFAGQLMAIVCAALFYSIERFRVRWGKAVEELITSSGQEGDRQVRDHRLHVTIPMVVSISLFGVLRSMG